MKKTFLVVLAIGVLMFGMVGMADAITLTSYTDYTAWQTAAGTTVLEDLNDESPGSFTSRNFGDFTATLYNQYSAHTPSITTDHKLRLQTWNFNSYTELLFDIPITALGFDWWNTDPTGDKIEMNILGTNWIFGPSQSSGFFGVIASGGMFDSAKLGDSVGNGGALTYGDLDNFRYSPIPEPCTMLLLGSGLIGLAGLGRKKFFKKS